MPYTHDELVKTVHDWEEKSRKRWEPIHIKMRSEDKLYQNELDYIKKGKKQKWQAQIGIPKAFRTVQNILGIAKDYMPAVDILPREENDTEFAQLVQLRYNHEADRLKLNRHFQDTLEDSLRFKNGIGKLTWVQDEGDRGAVYETVNPYAIWFPENATSVETSAYIICLYPMTLADIKREKGFEAKADALLNEEGMFEPFDNQHEQGSPSGGTVTDLDEKNETYAGAGISSYIEDGDYAFVREVWFTDPDTGDEMMVEIINDKITSKHPITGETGVIDNTANSATGYGRKPFFILKNNGSVHSLFGVSESQMVRSLIVASNEVYNSVMDWIKKAGNPPKYVMMTFLQNIKSRFLGKQHEQIPVNHPNEIGFLEIPKQPTMAANFADMIDQQYDNSTGIFGETIGNVTAGVTAGVAIAELKEAGETVVRYKINNEVTDFIEDVAKFLLFLILKFDDQSFMLTREEGSDKEYLPWNAKDFRDDIQFTLDEIISWEDTPFNIKVRAGQQQPQTRAELTARAEKLFGMRIYGVEEVVRDLGLKDGEKTIQRYYERQGWSPEAVEQMAEQTAERIRGNPEDVEAIAQMDVLNKIFPSITGDVIKKMTGEN